jgi:hypothetical protein
MHFITAFMRSEMDQNDSQTVKDVVNTRMGPLSSFSKSLSIN